MSKFIKKTQNENTRAMVKLILLGLLKDKEIQQAVADFIWELPASGGTMNRRIISNLREEASAHIDDLMLKGDRQSLLMAAFIRKMNAELNRRTEEIDGLVLQWQQATSTNCATCGINLTIGRGEK